MPGLLAGGDDERRLVAGGREQGAHGVTQARARVQVDQHGLSEPLGKAVGQGDDARFLQGQDIGEVGREIPQERLFGGPWVADDGGQAQAAQ